MFTHSHCWHSHHRMYVLPARARVGTKKGERKIFVRKLSFEKINIFVSSPLPSHSTVTVESCISLFMWCGWWRNGNISYIFIYQKTELRAKEKKRETARERERTLNSETGNFSSSQHGKTKMKWMWYGQHEQQNSVLVGVVSLSSSGMSHVQHDHE